MLSQRYRALLIEAAQAPEGVRKSRIDDAIKFIKAQSPENFFIDVNDKPDPAMKQRKFYDEPYNLDPADYDSFVIPYNGMAQQDAYKQRKGN